MAIPFYTPRSEYVGTGNTKDYTFNFKVFDKNDILIIHTDNTMAIVDMVRGNDLTFLTGVTLNGNAGTIHLTNNLPIGHHLIILQAQYVPVQDNRFHEKSGWKLKDFENAMDEQAVQIQSLEYRVQRSLKLDDRYLDTQVPFDMTMPLPMEDAVMVCVGNPPTHFEWIHRSAFIGPAGEINGLQVDAELEYDDPTPMAVVNHGTDTNAVLGFTLRKGPAATIAVGTVTSVDNTDPATVTNVGTNSTAIFDFEIPKGEKGESTVLVTAEPLQPDDGIGSDGDIWIDTGFSPVTKGNLYQKIAGTYTYKTNIMGPAGGVNSVDTEQGDLVYTFSGYSARFSEAFSSTSLRDTLNKILNFAYLGPLVTLNSNIGVGPYEKGQAITAINFTAAITKRSNDIAQVEFLQGGSVVDTQTSGGGIPSGGNSTYNWTGSITDTTSFSARVTDVAGGGGPSTVTGSRTFNYVFAYYHGVGATGLNAVQIAALTKVVNTPSASQVINYTLAVGEVPYFAYQNSLAALTQITDENGFDVTSSWSTRSVVITNIHGQAATYRVYEFNNPAGSANTTFYTFKR